MNEAVRQFIVDELDYDLSLEMTKAERRLARRRSHR